MTTPKQSVSERQWFEKGYVCAVAEIIRTHGEDVVAKDVLRAVLPVNWRNIDEYDRAALKDVRKDLLREKRNAAARAALSQEGNKPCLYVNLNSTP